MDLTASDVSAGRWPRGQGHPEVAPGVVRDVYVELLQPVVQAVDLVPWHQGKGLESGVSRGLGGMSLVGPFPTGPEPLDDIDEEQGFLKLSTIYKQSKSAKKHYFEHV